MVRVKQKFLLIYKNIVIRTGNLSMKSETSHEGEEDATCGGRRSCT